MPNNPFDEIRIDDESGAAQTASNPFEKIAADDSKNASVSMQQNFGISADKNPDEMAKYVKMANDLGTDVGFVQRQWDVLNKKQKEGEVDFDSLSQSNRGVSRFLDRPENMDISHDDIHNLKNVEDPLKSYYSSTSDKSLKDYAWDFAGSLRRGYNNFLLNQIGNAAAYNSQYQKVDQGFLADWYQRQRKFVQELEQKKPDYLGKLNNEMNANNLHIERSMQRFRDGWDDLWQGNMVEGLGDMTKGFGSTVADFMDKASVFGNNKAAYINLAIENYGSNFAGSIGTLGASSLGSTIGLSLGGPAGGLIGGQIGRTFGGIPGNFMGESGSVISDFLENSGADLNDPNEVLKLFNNKGLMSEAKDQGQRKWIGVQLVDSLQNLFLSGNFLEKAAGKGITRKIVAGAKDIAVEAGSESVQEIVSRPYQTMNLADLDLGEAIDEGLLSVFQAATDTASGVISRGYLNHKTSIAAKQFNEQTNESFRHLNEIKQINDASKKVSETALKDRSDGKTVDLLDNIKKENDSGNGGGNTFFQLDEWDNFWQNHNIDPREAADLILKDKGKTYDEAIITGLPIEVPSESIINSMANNENRESLLKIARTTPDGPSTIEALQHLQEAPGILNTLINEASGKKDIIDEKVRMDLQARLEAIDQSAKAIRDEITNKLVESGVPKTEAQFQSQIYEKAFRNLSERSGVDVTSIYNQFRPSIERNENIKTGQLGELLQSAPRDTSNDIIDFSPLPGLSEWESKKGLDFAKYLATDKALTDYSALPESYGGKLFDVDLIRELDQQYRSGREGRMLYTAATHGPASAFNKIQINNKIAETPVHGLSLWMAGGPGSGKGTTFSNFFKDAMNDVDFAVDGVLGNFDQTVENIHRNIDAGRINTVAFVFTPMEKAARQVVARFKETGRFVPADAFIDGHLKSIDSFINLFKLFKGDPWVDFQVFDNSGETPRIITIEDLEKLRYNKNDRSFNERINEVRSILNEGEQEQSIAKEGHQRSIASQAEPGFAGQAKDVQSEISKGNVGSVNLAKSKSQSEQAVRLVYDLPSQIEEKIKGQSATKEQIRSILKSVKKDETQWSGVEAFLATQPDKVLKEDLLNYLMDNQIKVKEDILATPKPDLNSPYAFKELLALVKEYGNDRNDFELALENDGQVYEKLSKLDPEMANNPDWPTLLTKKVFGDQGFPQFGEYTSDSSKNYREIIYSLPNLPISNEQGRFFNKHFDQPNVLAHARVTDGISADGKKTLFVEEIQSDWHEIGRKEGYKGALPNEMPPNFNTWAKQEKGFSEADAVKSWKQKDSVFQEYQKLNQERLDAIKKYQNSVPDAPFKNNWQNFVIKNLIKKAVNEGYEKVSFISGDEVVRRFKLGNKSAEGKKTIYDKIIPNDLNKFVKKYGGKLETSKLEVDGEQKPFLTLNLTDELQNRLRQDGISFFQTDKNKQALGKIIFGQDGKTIIQLSKNANRSTFLHETGHLFFRIMQNLANEPDSNPLIKEDFNTILNWLGAEKGKDLTVDQQEQFARGFEKYLAEGIAPSKDLKKAFYTFRTWLLNVYKDLKNLNVELNDDVRAVFDRLLATDSELEWARGEINVDPLFTDPEIYGIKGKDAEDYLTTREEMQIEAQKYLDKKQLKEIDDERKRQIKEYSNKISDELNSILNKRPEVIAQSVLRDGVMPDGSPMPAELEGLKISKKSIEDAYGKEALQGLSNKYFDKEGGDIRSVASMFNLEPRALLDVIKADRSKKELVKVSTDMAVFNKYPSLRFTPEISEEAKNAYYNDKRSLMLQKELEFLSKYDFPMFKKIINKIAKRPPTVKQVRAEAERFLGSKSISEIKPWYYQKAEVRFANEAASLLTKGDIDGAFEAKRKELFHHELYRHSLEATEDIKKTKAKWKKLYKSDEDLSKSREINYVQAARAILAEYGLGPKTKKDFSSYLEAMREYDADAYYGIAQITADAIANATDFKQMKFDDYESLRDTIGALWDLSKSTKEIEIAGKKEFVSDAKKKLSDTLPEIKQDKDILRSKPGKWDDFKKQIIGLKAAATRVEAWADAMDLGNSKGPWNTYVYKPIADATAKWREQRIEMRQKFLSIVKELGPIDSKAILAPELKYEFKTGKNEILHALIHRGNESNFRKMLLGMNWGELNEDGSLNSSAWDNFEKRMWNEGVLTKKDYDFAQNVWNLFNEIKPDSQKAHKKIYGYYFNEITNQPFTTPFGEYEGGYVPIKYDPMLNETATLHMDKKALEETPNSFMYPDTGKGFTKSRIEKYHAPVDLNLRNLPGHIDDILRFVYLQPAVKDVSKIVMANDFRQSLSQFDSEAGSGMLVPWLQRSARQVVTYPSGNGKAWRFVDNAARILRTNTGLNILAGNVGNSMQQLTGLAISSSRVPLKNIRDGFWRFITSPNETSDFINEKSSFMKTRDNGQTIEIQKNIDNIIINPSKFDNFKAFAREHGYFLASFTQNIVDRSTWMAAYDYAIQKGMNEDDAIFEADKAVRRTQGSFNPEDISRMETGTPVHRLFTMFYGYFNMQANLLGSEFYTVAKTMGLKKGAGKLFYLYALAFMVPAVLSESITKGLSGKLDDDDDGSYTNDLMDLFFGSQFRTGTAMFPVAGPLINATVNRFNNKWYDDKISTSPVISSLESVVNSPESVYKAIAEEGSKKGAARDVFTTLGLITGLPTGTLSKPVGYLIDVGEGKARPKGPIDFTRGLVSGKKGK